MHERLIGSTRVGAVGLGCMGMTWAYGEAGRNSDEAIRVIHHALDIGVTLIDTADVYGPFTNEALVGRALKGAARQKATLATKVGLVTGEGGIRMDGRPEHVRDGCEASLERLGVEVIDLYQLHRVDPAVAVEETWGAMAELVRAGKVRAIGLSEATAAQIRSCHSIHPVASVQSELSLWTRDWLREVMPLCATLSIAFIAYSPLGRGFLTGRFQTRDDFGSDDWRLNNPRFAADAMAANQRIVDAVKAIAARLGCSAGQVAIAWTLAQGAHVIPIPGTRATARLDENAAATAVRLSADDLAALDALPAPVGDRYPGRK